MKRQIIAGTGVLALALLAAASSANAAPVRTDAPDPQYTVDILVEMDLPADGSSGPMQYVATGVPVTDEIELDNPIPTDNPSSWGGTVTVDIAADLSSVIITGGESPNWFEEVYVKITVHEAIWGQVTVIEDTLFADDQQGAIAEGAIAGGAGANSLSSALRFDVIPLPTLQYAEVDNQVFEAYWLGLDSYRMDGVAVFGFTAPGAIPVEAEPTFTG